MAASRMGTKAICEHSCSRHSSHCLVARVKIKREGCPPCRQSSSLLQALCSSRTLTYRHHTHRRTASTLLYLRHLSAPTCLCAAIRPSRRRRTWRRPTRRSLRRLLCGTSGNLAQPLSIPPSDPSTPIHGNRALHSKVTVSILINNKYMDSRRMDSSITVHRILARIRSSTARNPNRGLRRTFLRHRL